MTVCLWRPLGSRAWLHGPIEFPDGDDPDGADSLFEQLDGSPETYVAYAEDYFELGVDRAAVEQVFRGQLLDEELVRALNPDVGLVDLAEDVREIGYPRP